jgi:hypothetical protein
MIAFFFTMPISRMMPISATTPSSVPADHQRQNRADARRRQRRENRDRMDVAFVKHAEHDVDRDDRRENQQRLVRQRRLERLRRALERSLHAQRHVRFPLRFFDRFGRFAQRRARREVEGNRHRRELALVVDRQRRGAGFKMRERAQRHRAAGWTLHVDVVQLGRDCAGKSGCVSRMT